MVSPGILGNHYLVMTQATNVKNTVRNTELNKYQERILGSTLTCQTKHPSCFEQKSMPGIYQQDWKPRN